MILFLSGEDLFAVTKILLFVEFFGVPVTPIVPVDVVVTVVGVPDTPIVPVDVVVNVVGLVIGLAFILESEP